MYENFEINERQTVPNENSKLSQSKFTKSLTLFHTKKNLSKIITQHNTIKSPYSFKQEKYSKTNRIFFSYKKKKELGYILTNPTSPKINKYYNPLKTYNSPNSDQRLYKFKNKYLLNYGINKYKTGSLLNNKSKKNKLKQNSTKDKKENNQKINSDKNISNNNSDANIKKANGASNNIINNNLNNSLVRSSDNFLHTIAITLNNNENTIQSNFIRFNGLNGGKTGGAKNKSVSNLNDFSSFASRNKILKKIKEKNNKMSKKKKKMNSIKNKKVNSIKKSSLVKNKSKAAIKTTTNTNAKNNNKKPHKSSINSNAINTNTNNNTNINKQSVNIENNIIQLEEIEKIREVEAKKDKPNHNDKQIENINNIKLTESDKKKNIKSNININMPNALINNDLIYETVDNNPLNEDFIKHFNLYNLINISNHRNNDLNLNKEGLNTLKTLNSMKSYQQSANSSNNLNNENNNINNNINIEDNNESNNNIGYQTFSGPFRKNIIKVNIIEKVKSKNSGGIKNNLIDSNNNNNSNSNNNNMNNNQNGLNKNNKGTKSANNLKNDIICNNNLLKKNSQINLHIDTDSNLKNNLKNLEINDISPERKTAYILNNKIIEHDIKNRLKQNRLFNSLLSSHSNLKLDKKNNSNSIINSFNFNIYPLSRDNSRSYFKNNSSTISYMNNKNKNAHSNYLGNNKNRSTVFKHNKSNSIFTSIYTQRNSKENKLSLKNKNNKNNINSNSSSSNNNNNKIAKHRKNNSVIVPEYKIKLDNIKSRVSNLLNVYSLLALKSLNSSNNNNNETFN